ncbi:MAG: AAA family ATPase [Gammaproteobacteria bacterium]|nr:AAA family ATPase [Gammaproteobacteria bacterium]
MKIQKFMLKNVRCFEDEQEFNIRPLTFLIGENSTGKSTVLGSMQALSRYFIGPWQEEFDFNREPYEMGAFADIARKVGGRVGRSRSFELGFEFRLGRIDTMTCRVELVERESGAGPIVKRVRLAFNDGEIILNSKEESDGIQSRNVLDGPYLGSKENEFSFEVNRNSLLSGLEVIFSNIAMPQPDGRGDSNVELSKLGEYLRTVILRQIPSLKGHQESELRRYFFELLPSRLCPLFESFAPIRSKPKRTYNPGREIEDSEGSEMPMVLMNMFRSDSKLWKDIQQELRFFGIESGLFQDISVRKLGKSTNDPFQLQIKVRGPKVNMIDVGYGVNQILPILVRLLRARKACFLIQQPEVHLHPKGQAELTSLLIKLSVSLRHSFVIESHSDYMIDRARIEIMKGRIKPEDVSLLYLKPEGNKVEVHNITFDKNANMIGEPPAYNDFFLKESNELLGF